MQIPKFSIAVAIKSNDDKVAIERHTLWAMNQNIVFCDISANHKISDGFTVNNGLLPKFASAAIFGGLGI